VAWGDAVRVGAVAAAPRGGGAGGGEPRRALEVVATLQMDCLVAVRALTAQPPTLPYPTRALEVVVTLQTDCLVAVHPPGASLVCGPAQPARHAPLPFCGGRGGCV